MNDYEYLNWVDRFGVIRNWLIHLYNLETTYKSILSNEDSAEFVEWTPTALPIVNDIKTKYKLKVKLEKFIHYE